MLRRHVPCVTEEEIVRDRHCTIRPRRPAASWSSLAEKRGTDDNLSVQVVEIQRVEQLLLLSRTAHLP